MFPKNLKNIRYETCMYKQAVILFSSMENRSSKYCGCLYYSANALARNITKVAEEAFSVTGLAPSHAFLVMIVNDQPGIHPKEISEAMMLTPSTITRLIEKLESKGLVERRSCGRATEVFPTAESKKLNKKIKSAWLELLERYSSVLGKNNAKRLSADVYEAALKLEK